MTDRYREQIRDILLEEGAGPGSSIHSWRCDHPDRYGECSCLDEVVEALSPILAQIKADARRQGLIQGRGELRASESAAFDRGFNSAEAAECGDCARVVAAVEAAIDRHQIEGSVFAHHIEAALSADRAALDARVAEARAEAMHEAALRIEQTAAEEWREPLVAGESPEQGLYNGANAAIRFATRVLREQAQRVFPPVDQS